MVDVSHFDGAESLTIGEVFGPAAGIEDQGEADAYFEALVGWTMRRRGVSRGVAVSDELHNLSCYAAHCSPEVEARMRRLFGCGVWLPMGQAVMGSFLL